MALMFRMLASPVQVELRQLRLRANCAYAPSAHHPSFLNASSTIVLHHDVGDLNEVPGRVAGDQVALLDGNGNTRGCPVERPLGVDTHVEHGGVRIADIRDVESHEQNRARGSCRIQCMERHSRLQVVPSVTPWQ